MNCALLNQSNGKSVGGHYSYDFDRLHRISIRVSSEVFLFQAKTLQYTLEIRSMCLSSIKLFGREALTMHVFLFRVIACIACGLGVFISSVADAQTLTAVQSRKTQGAGTYDIKIDTAPFINGTVSILMSYVPAPWVLRD